MSITKLSRDEWDIAVLRFRDLSHHQCGSYALEAADYWGARSECIGISYQQALIGLANVRLKTVPVPQFGIAYVHSGPLTAQDDGFSPQVFDWCLNALANEYVHGRGLVLRVIPPFRGGRWREAQAACFEANGFRPLLAQSPYQTVIVDLSVGPDEIRRRFRGTWRRELQKAEKADITITQSDSLDDFDRFEPLFLELASKKGFSARQDVGFFRRAQNKAHPAQRLLIHLAWRRDNLVAGHIGSFVGDTAVYLLGAANAEGRDCRASYLLHWAVITHGKRSGNIFYDLGGINPQQKSGVSTFKRGLSGTHVFGCAPYELAPSRMAGAAVHLLETAYKAVNRQKE
ncbi:MAG TPA: GNAT family N-acetyltransferase [Xanthobacteraceae bacterium]